MIDYKSKMQSEEMNFFCDAILALQTRDEVYRFLDDICTISEMKDICQRLQVARMLKQKRTYLDIASTTGASTATISRVNRSLSYGNDGYNIVFDRIKWKDE